MECISCHNPISIVRSPHPFTINNHHLTNQILSHFIIPSDHPMNLELPSGLCCAAATHVRLRVLRWRQPFASGGGEVRSWLQVCWMLLKCWNLYESGLHWFTIFYYLFRYIYIYIHILHIYIYVCMYFIYTYACACLSFGTTYMIFDYVLSSHITYSALW